MAILQAQAENSSGFQIDEIAPAGDFVATCIEIEDEFTVTRRKYQSEETEEIDITRFLFGFKAQDGRIYKVQTFEMKISGSPKSTLFKFLSSWLGQAPDYGWDYCAMKGKGAVISVESVTSQLGKTYAKIARVLPPKTSLSDYSAQVLPLETFAAVAVAAAPASAAMAAAAPLIAQAAALGAPAPVASAPAAWDPNAGGDANCPF
tara:strand:+ start:345 stop:959 length:615 start_codon:yes stop_codon:yes gene_type:complete